MRYKFNCLSNLAYKNLTKVEIKKSRSFSPSSQDDPEARDKVQPQAPSPSTPKPPSPLFLFLLPQLQCGSTCRNKQLSGFPTHRNRRSIINPTILRRRRLGPLSPSRQLSCSCPSSSSSSPYNHNYSCKQHSFDQAKPSPGLSRRQTLTLAPTRSSPSRYLAKMAFPVPSPSPLLSPNSSNVSL